MAPRRHLTRRLAVVLAATAAVLLVVALALPELTSALADARDGSRRRASFEDLLVRVCAVAAVAAAGCWWTGVVRLALAAVPGSDPAHLPAPAGLPPWLRTVVLAACGVVLVTAPTAPALADARADGSADGPGTDPVAALALPPATGDLPATGPGGLPLPDRVAGRAFDRGERRSTPAGAPGASVSTSAPRPAPATTVRVSAGDSLWLIAEAQLRAAGDPVDDASVATRWQEIYAANAARIGPDPDLVLPGQQLDLDRP